MPSCRSFPTVIMLATLGLAGVTVTLTADQKAFLGRWTLTSTDNPGVYWLEVKDDGGKLTAKFLNRGGHPIPVESLRVEGEELVFALPARENQPRPEFRGRVAGDRLTGTIKVADRTVALSGGHPPAWPASNANGTHTYGAPVALFDGKSLDAFGVQNSKAPMNWSIEEGVMTNGEHGNNLISKEKFKDFKLNAEYKVGPATNSGIYLRGRYELQVLDDFGKPAFDRGHMAIYGWKPPAANTSKPVGEWQSMEAIVVGNRVTVTHNGQRVHDNAVLEAVTGGALDGDELAPGPIMIQGDHTKVWFRKITVTPITQPGR